MEVAVGPTPPIRGEAAYVEDVQPFRFTCEEYHRTADAGIFEGRRVQLLDGEVIEMAPQSAPHAYAVMMLTELLVTRLTKEFVLRSQLPVGLDGQSEPEPDVAVCRRSGPYLERHPQPGDVVLIVEVSDSSLSFDRGRKARAYARAGVAEYWIVNLRERAVLVLREPDPASQTYASTRTAKPGDLLTLPGGASLRVDEVLPPAQAS